jgi:hypothetical protein
MIRPIKAIAVVDRKRPRLDVNDIYRKGDELFGLSSTEMKVEVLITPVTARQSVKTAPGRKKQR